MLKSIQKYPVQIGHAFFSSFKETYGVDQKLSNFGDLHRFRIRNTYI